MKWYGITGSWRLTSSEVESDVREAVREIIKTGDGIISGGALNVDYFATDEAMKLDPIFEKIKIYLPTTLEIYSAHYRKRASEGVITKNQAENLIKQLTNIKVKRPQSLIENQANKFVNLKTYYERNTKVVKASDALLAFQVNGSAGVRDAIVKAKFLGIKVTIKGYDL